jgi:hydrogenase nickel incorporation protein HypA/HybF
MPWHGCAVHELSICQGLLEQVEALVREHGACGVSRIYLRIGPLSGTEPVLLEQAFTFARVGTLADGAELVIDTLPIRVRCKTCAAETEATPNRLVCGNCGAWHTELLQGDELLLASLDLELEDTHV